MKQKAIGLPSEDKTLFRNLIIGLIIFASIIFVYIILFGNKNTSDNDSDNDTKPSYPYATPTNTTTNQTRAYTTSIYDDSDVPLAPSSLEYDQTPAPPKRNTNISGSSAIIGSFVHSSDMQEDKMNGKYFYLNEELPL